MIRLVLHREVASGNALAYGHWRNRQRDKKAWALHIRATGHPASHAELARGKRRVRVIAYRCRRLDDDNLIAGFKHGRDELVRACLLVDDNAKWSSWEYVQRLRSHPENPTPGAVCTVVEIEEST